VQETSNYIAAMSHGLSEIDGGRPLSLNLATDTTRRIVQMIERDRARIESELGRAAGSALRVHHLIVREIALGIPEATSRHRTSLDAGVVPEAANAAAAQRPRGMNSGTSSSVTRRPPPLRAGSGSGSGGRSGARG
jgi:hypothetical protein